MIQVHTDFNSLLILLDVKTFRYIDKRSNPSVDKIIKNKRVGIKYQELEENYWTLEVYVLKNRSKESLNSDLDLPETLLKSDYTEQVCLDEVEWRFHNPTRIPLITYKDIAKLKKLVKKTKGEAITFYVGDGIFDTYFKESV